MNDPNTQTVIALNLTIILQLAGVSLAALMDIYISRDNCRRFYAIAALVLFLLIEPQISARWGDVLYASAPIFWNTLLSITSYIVRTVVLYLFVRITGNEWRIKVLYVILAINAAICLSAFFGPWVFYYGDSGAWHRGPLGAVPFISSFVMVLWIVVGALVRFRGIRRREILVPIIISVIVAIAVIMDVMLDFSPRVSYLTIAMTESTVFFYVWLHLQFVREHENALKAEQRIRIMMSQIQPHFLFNTLSTIQALTETDPERASQVIEEFAIYLRRNINSLEQDSLIPVKKEIEHTKVYSDIEKVRFPSIRIDYEIEDEDFLIPPLTIQPMVENAIRHGVRGKKNGWVSVNVYGDGEYHVISVRDNGKGFDVDQMIDDTRNGNHIGVKNVRDRIVDMTHGTFAIESETGVGTSVTIRIPAEA